MMRHDSRNGWQVVRLGDVTSIESGSGFPTEYQGATSGQYPFYKVSDMNLPGNEIFMRFHNNAIKEQVRAELKAKAHPIGTVIFPKIGAAIATNKKRILTQESCFDNNVIGIYPSPKLDSVFLYHMLLIKDLSDFANTGNPPSIRKTTLEDWQIPLPPLTEQKRIAGILDAADALRAKRRAALAELDTLLQSTFLDMFGDPVTNPMGWEECSVGDVAELGTGSTPSRKNDLYFQGDIPWVKSTEVDWGTVTRTSECVSATGQKAARLKIYPKGSIILALYGQGKTRGKCAILGLDATINQACCALLPRSGCSTRYLFAFLKHSYLRLRGESRGGNQENLNLSIVRGFPIPLPPTELQTQFAEIVESIERQKVRMSDHLSELDALFASLQSRAFNGEL